MAFTIRNISPIPVSVLGIELAASTNLDLQENFTNATIVSSLEYGELYELLFGRMIAAVNPTHFYNIGATQAQIDTWAYAGFMQGCFGDADLHYPFKFDGYGNLKTEVEGITIDSSGLIVSIRGDMPVPADRDSILAMGTDDGTIAGTVHVLKIAADGYAQVEGMVQGISPDHTLAHENPVFAGGKYLADPTADPLNANDKGHLLVDILRNLSVTLGTKIAGEDFNLDVINTLAGCTYLSITTNTTTVIKAGPGALLGILFTTPGSVDNTVIFYDNTAASGTVLIPSVPTDVAFTPKMLYLGGIYFNTGLTAITATGTASSFVVFYR